MTRRTTPPGPTVAATLTRDEICDLIQNHGMRVHGATVAPSDELRDAAKRVDEIADRLKVLAALLYAITGDGTD